MKDIKKKLIKITIEVIICCITSTCLILAFMDYNSKNNKFLNEKYIYYRNSKYSI